MAWGSRLLVLGGLAAMLASLFGACALGAPAATPKLTLSGPTKGAGDLKYRVTTTAAIASPGTTLSVELRGIDLSKVPRSTFDRADVVRTGCKRSPCTLDVAEKPGAHFQFEAFLIDRSTLKTVATSKPITTTWASSPVSGVTFFINGQAWPLNEAYNAPDLYLPIPAGKLQVETHWNSALPAGYKVTISTSEPKTHVYAKCASGTACRAPAAVPILAAEEMSWRVTILDSAGAAVDAYQVCLLGKP